MLNVDPYAEFHVDHRSGKIALAVGRAAARARGQQAEGGNGDGFRASDSDPRPHLDDFARPTIIEITRPSPVIPIQTDAIGLPNHLRPFIETLICARWGLLRSRLVFDRLLPGFDLHIPTGCGETEYRRHEMGQTGRFHELRPQFESLVRPVIQLQSSRE